MNSKILFVAAVLVMASGCGKNFDGRYEGVEMNPNNAYNSYPSTAVMNLKQDGDIVTGDYTVQRTMGQMGQQGGSTTYRLTARAEKSDSLEGVQLYVTQNAQSQYGGQWGQWGNMSSCAALGGNLSAPDDGKQITGAISQVGGAQGQMNNMCSFTLNLTKVSDD